MKITAITPYPVRIGVRNQLLVKVETDEGIYGWGESGLSYRELAVAGAIKHYANFLIGRDPMQSGALWQEMYRSQYFEGGRVLTAAQAALDIAFHDIRGKALGVPVHQLLGGQHRKTVPAFGTTSAAPGPEMVEQALILRDAGWNCVRLLAEGQENPEMFEPRESIGKTAEWAMKVREAIGHEVVLGVEYHHRLSVGEAANFAQKVPAGTLDFLEEPIRDEAPGAYEALRRMTDIPFALGEEFSSKWQFLPYLERDIVQYARLDICNVGGFTEAMKVAGLAEAHYIDLMPHNPLGPVCTAASVHLGAAVPNFAWLECRASPVEQLGFESAELCPKKVELDGAAYVVPMEPGLGVEVDEEFLKRAEFEYIDPPMLRRRDGSITNW
ncbi:mandelate racemase/muconate lactonizing enzyme family protein [Pelagovum pacificum]|uniref:Mandelate racemase/muconate lactonizing enzyme family protein n=1 Tax=Pelagovum pacificum TaxID=2588711 RepID=A0A5C5GJN8_9RHOB|nr:mandelate racemase/muconate lactonizing enzyme family protein [Pelagovum pacificum]QQA42803.1 mandelate racemase/muconate lactonizing enzyme family protein [Pelagovum pacificum]TNY34049.1 mandelate racemase/muconate lactonizing enzyme family protein [Pelagovum pacificum]